MQWPSWSSRTQPFALEPAWDIEERAHHRRGLRMMDESDGDFARGIELPNLDASRLFGVDVPHARGSDTGANAAEESRRIAAFDHAVQDCAGAFAGLVEQSAPLLGGGRADHRQLVERERKSTR